MSKVSTRIFTPGAVVEPVAGTIRWQNGVAVGTWGDERNNGSLRPANRAERRMALRLWPKLRRGGR